MATTTTTSTAPGPDWGALAQQGLGFLEALAATVTPTSEEKVASSNFDALVGALGHPPDLNVQLNAAQPKVVIVQKPPDGVDNYRIGDFRTGGTREAGKFDVTTGTIKLKSVDLTKRTVPLELYDKRGVLLARVVLDIRKGP